MLPKYKYGFLLFGSLTVVFLIFSGCFAYEEWHFISRTATIEATVLEYTINGDKPNEKYKFNISYPTQDGYIENSQIELPSFEARDAIRNGHFEILYLIESPQEVYRLQSHMLPVLCLLLSLSSFISMNVYRRKWIKTRNKNKSLIKKSVDSER